MKQYQKIIFILTITLYFNCGAKKETNDAVIKKETNDAVISTKYGEIVLELYDTLATKHVESFKLHAQNGYYDGTTFHRVIPGFMIQGGDPNSRSDDRRRHGSGGNAAKYFGIGTEPHERGILSMARSNNPDSGGSQFFICVADARFLDNQYTVFGKVVSGMSVADAIVSEPRDTKNNPNNRIEMTVRVKGMKIK